MGAAKIKQEAIRTVVILWSTINKYKAHKKTNASVNNDFLIGFYIIQLLMTDLNCLLIIKVKHVLSPICYFRYLSDRWKTTVSY